MQSAEPVPLRHFERPAGIAALNNRRASRWPTGRLPGAHRVQILRDPRIDSPDSAVKLPDPKVAEDVALGQQVLAAPDFPPGQNQVATGAELDVRAE